MEGRKRSAIHSGIGDNDDLFVKRPNKEDVTEEFQYAARLRGKKRHDTMIYPEIPFEYGISYTGKTVETYNEKEYEFGINAHPEKTIAYCIEETKELPIKRLWEAKACFEAEVLRHNMKYAIEYKGHTGKVDKRTAEYAVRWKGLYTVANLGDLKQYCTTKTGDALGDVGYGNWTMRSAFIEDKTNTSKWSGVIAKDAKYKAMDSYDVTYKFKPQLANGTGNSNNAHRKGSKGFYKAYGWDDDCIGFIFKAKDKNNFYMLLIEGEERVWKGSRPPDRLDGLRINAGKGKDFIDQAIVERTFLNASVTPTNAQWNNYRKNVGWKQQHRRVYRVKNGVLRRVDVNPSGRPGGANGYDSKCRDLGSGKGWIMNSMQGVRVESVGRHVIIYMQETPNGSWKKIYDFQTDWSTGSFGVINVSQAVEFHSVNVVEKKELSGRIPESGWDKSTQTSNKTIASNASTYVRRSDSFKSKVGAAKPPGGAGAVKVTSVTGQIRNSENGSITIRGLTSAIVVKAFDYTTLKNYSGRIPKTGWFEFDGIGDKVHAPNAQEYIRKESGVSNMIVDSIKGIVQDAKTGRLIISAKTGPIIARNNNAPDAGKKYSKCYIRCGIVEVTPDHRDYRTGLVVWEDIAHVFRDDYKEFFNRPDYIKKKATYELLQPVKKEPPKPPPPKEESEAGCVIEEDPPPVPEEPIIECLNDFEFDGKKLVMWSCEFPIQMTKKCFEDKVFAYRGWITFNPLANFDPNKWTVYELMPEEATIDPRYDEIRWAGWPDYDKAPVGTKVIIRTTEWYKALFPADIVNTGIVNSEENLMSEIPPAPEHFWHPDAENDQDVTLRMPDHFEIVHYLLDAWNNHSDVVMWFESNPSLTTDNADKRAESLAREGKVGMPIVLTSNDNDKIIIHCKEDPRYFPWSSGKYIGYGKVNGKRPFWGDGSGKADMVNISTEVVYFPDNLVLETLEGPFIDIFDKDFPDEPRVKYKLHSENKLVDFYSSHTDAHIWYTDWYSNWVESEEVFQAAMHEASQIEGPLDLDPMNPSVSPDYNPDSIYIERIEVTSNNPFVKLWIEEDKGKHSGLLGTYYRFPLTSTIFEEKWQVKGSYQEWVQPYDIKPYMTNIEVNLQHPNFKIIEVTIDGVVIPNSLSNGWIVYDNSAIKLNGNAIRPGMLNIKYSTGDVINTFPLEKEVGTHVEVFVNGALLDPKDYSIIDEMLIINKNQLYLHDWVHIQSYKLHDLYDPTRRYYMGEKQYAQLDFQEDVPSTVENPNYDDPYYEGSFCFNWGYDRPKGMYPSSHALGLDSDIKMMSMFLPEQANFRFNVDMELVHPVGRSIDISNFTGEWRQWDQQTLFREGETIETKTGNGPGDWHGPPEKGFPEVTNLRNQNSRSGWYNPEHVNLTDYDFKFKVQARKGDDDMYGAIFKFDPKTQNFYSFEWDGHWGLNPPANGVSGVHGMVIFKNICRNPEVAGTGDLLYTKTPLARADISWIPHTSQVNEIRISTIGNRIKVWTNNILRFDIEDNNDPFLKGAWGPLTQSQPDTYFWDFWIQTFRRVTYRDRANFRQAYNVSRPRPLAGPDGKVEIDVDTTTMRDKFNSIIDAYSKEAGIQRSDVVSVDYFITEDRSEAPVYFKQDKSTHTQNSTYTIASTIDGQYPSVEAPDELGVTSPPEPVVPDIEPPKQGNPNDGFTITWNGYIYAPVSGVYKFKATINDGFRLWVRGEEIISEWHTVGEPDYFPDYEGSIYLEGNKWHPIRANFFENVGQALMRLHWAIPKRGFQRISSDYLTPHLGYKLFAQVKKSRPLPWHPLIHNGYYYHKDEERYLYAEKIIHKKTPNSFHEVMISPRPQQGSAIIVRDNEGNNLRKVTFYDENWNLTLENKEEFKGNGYAKYYLSYKGIDEKTIKVKLNGKVLLNHDFIFNEENSSIEFMEPLSLHDQVEVRYILLYSYYLDMNADDDVALLNRDIATIRLHSNYDKNKMTNMEIIYESAKHTPFYRAEEVVFNPILNHNHTGFLYLTEKTEQSVKNITLNISDKTLSDSGLEKVLITAKVTDEYNNPCPNKTVKIYRDGVILREVKTNEGGEVYVYDKPTPTANKISTYRAECESASADGLLNYYVDNRTRRHYLDISAQKLTVMAGVEDESAITITLRDHNWNTVGANKAVKVDIRNTFNEIKSQTLRTDGFGQVKVSVSGLNERHGEVMIKASYDMGFEAAANYVYLKVIGG